MNTSLIRTALGRTIVLQHDVVSPRPYDRINMVSGTKGAFRDYPPRIFLDGQEAAHDWQDARAAAPPNTSTPSGARPATSPASAAATAAWTS